PPSQINRQLTRDIDALVLRCLEKEPAKRYQASQLTDDCHALMLGGPITASRSGMLSRAHKRLVRHTGRLGAALTMLALTTVALSPLTWWLWRPDPVLFTEIDSLTQQFDTLRDEIAERYEQFPS